MFRLKPGKSLYLGPKEAKDLAKQETGLKYIRGNIIELVISVEDKIDTIITNCFVKRKSKYFLGFVQEILYSRNMFFTWKMNILNRLIRDGNLLSSQEASELQRNLEYLNTERNKFAHGRIIYEQLGDKKLQSFLQYRDTKGKNKEKKLVDSYFDDLSTRLNKIHKHLDKILVKLKLFKVGRGKRRKGVLASFPVILESEEQEG